MSRMLKMEDFWQTGGDPWGSGGHLVDCRALGLLWPFCLSFRAWPDLWAVVATLALLQGMIHDGPFSAWWLPSKSFQKCIWVPRVSSA